MPRRFLCFLLVSFPILAQDVQLGLEREKPRGLQINPPGGFLRFDSTASDALDLRASWDLWHPLPGQALEVGAGLRAPSERQLTYRNSTGTFGDVQARLRLDWQPSIGFLYRFEHPWSLPMEVGLGLEARQERLVLKDGGFESPGTLHRAWFRLAVRHRFQSEERGPFLAFEVAKPLAEAPTPSGVDYLLDLDHLGSSPNPGTAATSHGATYSVTLAVGWRFGRSAGRASNSEPFVAPELVPSSAPVRLMDHPKDTVGSRPPAPLPPMALPPPVLEVKPRPQVRRDLPEALPAADVVLHFAVDSADVPLQGRSVLAAWIARMKRVDASATLQVFGYADATGTVRHNRHLSLARAKGVAAILRSEGLKVTEVRGFGSQKPAASNRSLEGRGRNRRVEIQVASEPPRESGTIESDPVIVQRPFHTKSSTPKKRFSR